MKILWNRLERKIELKEPGSDGHRVVDVLFVVVHLGEYHRSQSGEKIFLWNLVTRQTKYNIIKESTAKSLNFADGIENHFEKVKVNSHHKTYLRCESESEFITCHKFPLWSHDRALPAVARKSCEGKWKVTTFMPVMQRFADLRKVKALFCAYLC